LYGKLIVESRLTKLFNLQATQVNPRVYEEHQMDYPSNEGALMTIGFLTFAVFLIKLVLVSRSDISTCLIIELIMVCRS